uniref:Uncharacterized protein n=1 Tax=Myotis myotis TaxID=51298 RepID=A0A7J7SRA1_MYOMY|nr:hypothetical protein mMyoMyo1_009304 [Myotis myotis]
MAMTLPSGGGRLDYGSIPPVVLMPNPTADPYPAEKLRLPAAPPHPVCCHACLCGRVRCLPSGIPQLLPPCALLNGPRAPLCVSALIALAQLDWATREESGRRPRGLFPLLSPRTREAGTGGSEWAQMSPGVIQGVVVG